MSDADAFWNAWAPYWSHIEDNYLDLNSVNRLAGVITDPTLVIGAGQGLLVELLRDKGLSAHGVDLEPLMIEYALERRGLRLIRANGAHLPMADRTYRTSIIATGVVDLMDDETLIASIINEALRVTAVPGSVLVAFYRVHPRAEKLFRSAGLISDQDVFHQRLVYRMSRQNPFELIATVSKQANIGYLRSLLTLARFPILLPARETRMALSLSRIFKQAKKDLGSPDPLIDTSAETVPFRNEQSIRALFMHLDLRIHRLHVFDTCNVVQIRHP